MGLSKVLLSLLVFVNSSWLSSARWFGRRLQSSCLGSTDVLGFENIGLCSNDRILDSIEQALAAFAYDCSNDVWGEAKALSGKVTNYGAMSSLRRICNSEQRPCTTIERLGFRDIGECTNRKILDAIEASLGEKCLHDQYQEAKLLANTVSSTTAIFLLKRLCEEQIVQVNCTTVQALEFSTIENCYRYSIHDRIEDAIGENCNHDHRVEATLLTGTDNWWEAYDSLEEMCKLRFGCTLYNSAVIVGCDFQTIIEEIEDSFSFSDCPHDANTEVQLITGTNSIDEAKQYIQSMCADAWSRVDVQSFSDIDARFNDSFMIEYFNGGTFLNMETGNFQGRDNPAYVTSYQSLSAGQSIKDFFYYGARGTILRSVPNLDKCLSQAMMCCFGRDRQSNDNNGNCADNDCKDADPADNSNLCFTEPSNTPFPLDSEGKIHCHGLAWAQDDNHYSSRFRNNNLYFVAFYDHLYSRGYVNKAVENSDNIPMCGCVEDMPPVSRSDCTQVDAYSFMTMSRDNDLRRLEVSPRENMRAMFSFNACEGDRRDNDLASHTVKLVSEGKMSKQTQAKIFEILLGYEDPHLNENERACAAGYEAKTGQKYPTGN